MGRCFECGIHGLQCLFEVGHRLRSHPGELLESSSHDGLFVAHGVVADLAAATRVADPGSPSWELLGASLFAQLAGNVVFQWALGVIGMAMCVPLCLGALIISSALMSRRLLDEHFSFRDLMAMSVLILAVAVLSRGAADAHASVAGEEAGASFWLLAGGVAAAALSGVAYAVLGVVIRRCVCRGARSITALCIVSTTGFISLGLLSYWRLGGETILLTPSRDVFNMLMAGVFNAAAFVALTQSLRLIPVMYVNGINATQTGMAGLAGIWLFREALSWPLVLGVVLTIAGLFLMGSPPSQE